MSDNETVPPIDAAFWAAPTALCEINATVELPGSKSQTNRALVLAALSSLPSTIYGALRSRDSELMISALRALGVSIDLKGNKTHVSPAQLHGAEIECGLAGTVMRFVPVLAALAHGPSSFDGDAHARSRPQTTILQALRDLGTKVDGETLPFTVFGKGELAGGELEIDASQSSQFVTGLLLPAARFTDGLKLRHIGPAPVPSRPHIDMTISMLSEHGVTVFCPDERTWVVRPGPISPVDRRVEPDLSNASCFLAAAMATGGYVEIPHWPLVTDQAGDSFRGIAAEMGALLTLAPTSETTALLSLAGKLPLQGIDCDLSAIGELAPTVAALCALAEGPSRLRGIGHLRGHETDRLAALVFNINELGGNAEETDDGLIINPARLHGGVWRAFADHRMATAGAIVGLKVDGVEVDDIGCTSKTLPDFPAMWTTMLADSARG